MPKISALNTIAQLSTSSILPVVDDNQTQKVTLKRVIEFVSASIDVTFATEIELLQSASSITSSLNAFASASILNVNAKLSTSSFEAYTASVSSANTSSLLLTSSFNTYTSSNDTTNTTQNSRLTSLENNSGSYLLKTQTGSFALTSSNNFTGKQTFSDVIYASQIQNLSGSVYISTPGNNVEIQGSNLVVPNGGIITSFNVSASSFTGSIDWNYIQNSPSLITSSNQITNLGFATTSSLAVVTPFLSSSTFNSYTSSNDSKWNTIGGQTGSFITEAETGSFATTGSNTFKATQTIAGNLFLSSSFPLVYNNSSANNMLFGLFDGSTIHGAYYQIFGNTYPNITQRGGAEFVYDVRNNPNADFHIASFNGSSWTPKFVVNDSGAQVTGSLNVSDGITGSLDWVNLINVPNGIVSGSSQIISLLPNGVVSGSSQILDGTGIYSSSNQLPNGLVSGSSQVLDGSNIVSSSTQITAFGFISSSADVTPFLSASIFNTFTSSYVVASESFDSRINAIVSAGVPTGTISGSTQIVNLGFATTSSVLNIDTSSLVTTSSFQPFSASINTATSSLNSFTSSINTTIKTKLNDDNVLSGSISYGSLTGVPSGIVSSSTQIIAGLPSGTISGSSQVLSGTGIVSSSTQITEFGYVTTSSFNSYTSSASTNVSGAINVATQSLSSSISITTSTLLSTSSFNTYTASISASAASLSGNNTFTGTNVFSGSTFFSGSVVFEESREVIVLDSNFGLGTRNFDYNSGSTFYLNNLTGSGTWNVQNFVSSSQRVTPITFVVEQGATAYSASAYQLGGSAVTVKWQNGATPIGSANKTDVFALSVFRSGSTFNVLGSYSTFG